MCVFKLFWYIDVKNKNFKNKKYYFKIKIIFKKSQS
jgi:hypothetical protein